VIYIRAASYGIIALGLCIPMFGLVAVKLGFGGWATIGFTLGMSVGVGVAVAAVGAWGSQLAGGAVEEVLLSGSGAPYLPQYSYEQALVMQGKVAEALRSFEGHIAKPGSGVDVRIRAAELYATSGDPARAAELLREVQTHKACAIGQDVYASNRLVDLLNGPLNQPGRALVELRRLIDRYPNSTAASHAREALARLKAGPES
jgi:hypothetical protein